MYTSTLKTFLICSQHWCKQIPGNECTNTEKIPIVTPWFLCPVSMRHKNFTRIIESVVSEITFRGTHFADWLLIQCDISPHPVVTGFQNKLNCPLIPLGLSKRFLVGNVNPFFVLLVVAIHPPLVISHYNVLTQFWEGLRQTKVHKKQPNNKWARKNSQDYCGTVFSPWNDLRIFPEERRTICQLQLTHQRQTSMSAKVEIWRGKLTISKKDLEFIIPVFLVTGE